MRPFNTAGSLIPPFFPSFSRLFSSFFYCTPHAHTFPVLLVTVHGVATAMRIGPWRGPEFGGTRRVFACVLFKIKTHRERALRTKNLYAARSFSFRLSLCPISPLLSSHSLLASVVCAAAPISPPSPISISDLDLGNTGREYSKRFDFSKLATERSGGAASSLEDADANVAREVAGSTLRATTHP